MILFIRMNTKYIQPLPQMSMWKPILNQAHFDRIHKTKPHQEKALYGEQHAGTILKNCSQKHNQLLKNNWPPIKVRDYVTNPFDHQVYTNKKLWHLYIHTYILEFNTQWPLRGQFAIKPNHHQSKHLLLQIIYIIYM